MYLPCFHVVIHFGTVDHSPGGPGLLRDCKTLSHPVYPVGKKDTNLLTILHKCSECVLPLQMPFTIKLIIQIHKSCKGQNANAFYYQNSKV